MMKVTGVVFDEIERDEIKRALRWVGIHPDADLEVHLKKRAQDVRQRVHSHVYGLAYDMSPAFYERLSQGVEYLQEMLTAANAQRKAAYWTMRGNTPGQADVLAKVRAEAAVDIGAALTPLLSALLLADAARPAADIPELV